MINQLLVEFYLSQWKSRTAPVKTQAKTALKANSYSEARVDPLVKIQEQCTEQSKSLNAINGELAQLQMQLKQFTPVSHCEKCLHKSANLDKTSIAYRVGQTATTASIYHGEPQHQDVMLKQDNAQEDAYWL